jgi:hypothetical protein
MAGVFGRDGVVGVDVGAVFGLDFGGLRTVDALELID